MLDIHKRGWFNRMVGFLSAVDNIRPDGRADGHKVHPYSCTGTYQELKNQRSTYEVEVGKFSNSLILDRKINMLDTLFLSLFLKQNVF